MNRTFIAWIGYSRRSELLAERFGASMHHITFGQRKKKWQIPIRYIVQSYRTFMVLLKERSDVVFVQNPPIIIMFPVYLYCMLFRARYVIDSHTGAFTDFPRLQGLHRWFSNRSLIVIVHNDVQEEIVKAWGSPYVILGFADADYPDGTNYPVNNQFNIAFSCSFADDEPVLEIFEAARLLPEVDIYITGNDKHLSDRLRSEMPANCHLTGFLTFDEYVGLLRKSDAVMSLTTRDGTLLSGGFEAVSLEKPLIVSDWPVLKEYFTDGTVYVDNTAQGIYDGIVFASQNLDSLNEDVKQLRIKLAREYAASGRKVMEIISGDNR